MKKKIFIGSMLVLTLLLLMPSIPAVQQRSIEEGFKQDLQEKLDEINLDDLKDFKALDGIKHPLLYYLVITLGNLRSLRFAFFFLMFVIFCTEDVDEWGIRIIHPILANILALRAGWFLITIWAWGDFWSYISDELGWNWW